MTGRAVSTTIGYTLTLVVTTLLATGLLVAGGDLVDDQRERTVRTGLEVVGEQVAAELAAADRLARTTDPGNAQTRRDLPETIAGTGYTIDVKLNGANERYLVLSTTDPDVSVGVNVTTVKTIDHNSTPIKGGDIRVSYADTGANNELVIERD